MNSLAPGLKHWLSWLSSTSWSQFASPLSVFPLEPSRRPVVVSSLSGEQTLFGNSLRRHENNRGGNEHTKGCKGKTTASSLPELHSARTARSKKPASLDGRGGHCTRTHTRSAGTSPQSLLSPVLELGHRRDMVHLQASCVSTLIKFLHPCNYLCVSVPFTVKRKFQEPGH